MNNFILALIAMLCSALGLVSLADKIDPVTKATKPAKSFELAGSNSIDGTKRG